jgi:ABC-type transporter MlaC component
MKQLRLILVGAALVCAPAYVAVAQAPRPANTTQRWTVDAYLDKLGRHMAITPFQKAAWKTYADTLTRASKDMERAGRSKMPAMEKASWHERCTMMNHMLMTRKDAAGMAHKAATDLLPTLTEEQKQKAQSELPGLALPPAAGLG